MSNRIEKINDLIRDNVSNIINKSISLKQGVFVSITKVDTSKDLRYTKIFISIFPKNEVDYVMKTLKKEIFRIQKLSNQSLNVKIFPKISFRFDGRGEKMTELDKIFEQIKAEEQ